MENKINIAELLKDCPKGMELDCTAFNNVKFQCADNDGIWIEYIDSDNNNRVIYLKCDGGIKIANIETNCVIFPKGKTTWEEFHRPFKDGDVVYTVDGDGSYRLYIVGTLIGRVLYTKCSSDDNGHFLCVCEEYIDTGTLVVCRLATEEEKEKLFQAIKDNGYKWNEENKNLEKLVKPKFKIGDRIRHKCEKFRNERTITSYDESGYWTSINDWIDIAHQDDWELVSDNLIEPKFKVGDKIKQTGSPRCYIIKTIEFDRYILNNNQFLRFRDEHIYELVPNKFDINNLKSFDKVLMRSSNAREWVATFYSHYSNNKFYGCGMCCDQCIPYKGNEHLLGKTDDCEEHFKTWD